MDTLDPDKFKAITRWGDLGKVRAGIDAALAAYERLRRPHTDYYQFASRWLTPVFQSHSRVMGWTRDAFLGSLCHVPLAGAVMRLTLEGRMQWRPRLWRVDPAVNTTSEAVAPSPR